MLPARCDRVAGSWIRRRPDRKVRGLNRRALHYHRDMTWDDLPLGSTSGFDAFATPEPEPAGLDEAIELFGTDLRVSCVISLGRFPRLTDLFSSFDGFFRVRDARVLAGDGTAIGEPRPELMVNQAVISFIAEPDAPLREPGTGSTFDEFGAGGNLAERRTRRFELFTTGYSLSGSVYLFGETSLSAFVDSTHPHFIPINDVTVRSLDRGDVSRYPFVLLNRSHMTAAAELDGGDQGPDGGLDP
jgi:hypothetical protein